MTSTRMWLLEILAALLKHSSKLLQRALGQITYCRYVMDHNEAQRLIEPTGLSTNLHARWKA